MSATAVVARSGGLLEVADGLTGVARVTLSAGGLDMTTAPVSPCASADFGLDSGEMHATAAARMPLPTNKTEKSLTSYRENGRTNGKPIDRAASSYIIVR